MKLWLIALLPSVIWATSLEAQRVCGKELMAARKYCLELKSKGRPSKNQTIALLVPGFTQNARIWDLSPKLGISVVDYLEKKFNIHSFVLNTKGVGASDYLPLQNLDFMAMDDIRIVMDFLHQNFPEKKVLLIGHSQGAMVTAAYASGLASCLKIPCFNPIRARQRQKRMLGLGLITGNVALTTDHDLNPLNLLVKMGEKAMPLIKNLDHIDLRLPSYAATVLSVIGLWDGLVYLKENVGLRARAILHKTIDSTTGMILQQFIKGHKEQGVKTLISNLSYKKNYRNIIVPTYQVAFSQDPISMPEQTRNDSFKFIGSSDKEFEEIIQRSHEDFFLNKEMHSDLDSMINYLLSRN